MAGYSNLYRAERRYGEGWFYCRLICVRSEPYSEETQRRLQAVADVENAVRLETILKTGLYVVYHEAVSGKPGAEFR